MDIMFLMSSLACKYYGTLSAFPVLYLKRNETLWTASPFPLKRLVTFKILRISCQFTLHCILSCTGLFWNIFFLYCQKKQKLVGIRMKFPLWSLGGHLQSQLECRAVKSSLLLEVTNYLINLSDQTKAFFFFFITSGRFSWTALTVSWTQEGFKFKCCCRINC